MSSFDVRPASKEDLEAIGSLAARLVREHHGYDPHRFMLQEPVEDGYRWWLGRELGNGDAVVLVAVEGETVVGYAYGRIEDRNWNELLDAHGALHDIYVDAAKRRAGVATALLTEMIARLGAMGAPIVVLSTATANRTAQAFFAKHGFRPTMIEMARDVEPS